MYSSVLVTVHTWCRKWPCKAQSAHKYTLKPFLCVVKKTFRTRATSTQDTLVGFYNVHSTGQTNMAAYNLCLKTNVFSFMDNRGEGGGTDLDLLSYTWTFKPLQGLPSFSAVQVTAEVMVPCPTGVNYIHEIIIVILWHTCTLPSVQ